MNTPRLPIVCLTESAAAVTAAEHNNHELDDFGLEDGRYVSVCGCGVYVFVEYQAGRFVWGHGRLGRRGHWSACENV